MINKCHLAGELLNKKLSITKNGKAMLEFTLRTWEIERMEFLDCIAYGQMAETINRDFSHKSWIYGEFKAHSYKVDNDLRIQFVMIDFKYVTKRNKDEADN